eukprot:gene3782-4715_t
MSQMKPLNDQFAMAEACLIADAIEMFEFVKAKTGENYSPSVVIEDVRSAIEEIHITRSLHRRVTEDLNRYIAPSPDLLPMLEHLRVSGKSLFLCTNSGYKYAHIAISHALGLPITPTNHKSPDWSPLFDLVVCSAKKPDFYNSSRPFRLWDRDSDRASTSPVTQLQQGEVYVTGSVQALKRLKSRVNTSWYGKEVLYV